MPQPRAPRQPRPGTPSAAARPYARKAPTRNPEAADSARPYVRKATTRTTGAADKAGPYARKAPVRKTGAADKTGPYARKAPVRKAGPLDKSDPYSRKAVAAENRTAARKPPVRYAEAAEKARARPAAVKRGPLSLSQKRYLRGLAHALKPVIMIGQKGVTEAVLAELEIALAHHELLKVKLADGERESRLASIELIRSSAQAELIQIIGHVACFFRSNPEQSAFTLPK